MGLVAEASGRNRFSFVAKNQSTSYNYTLFEKPHICSLKLIIELRNVLYLICNKFPGNPKHDPKYSKAKN